MLDNKYKTGEDRNQISFFSLEDMIDKNDSVRIIDKVVDEMSVCKFNFKYSSRKNKGQHPYNPADMLKLYIYCCMNGVRSSRRIEKQCYENIKVMWLMKNLKPDHKTISNFRKNNHDGIKEVFCDFVLLCENLGFIGGQLLAVDGSKFRANNSKDKYHTLKKVEKKIEYREKQILEYIKMLDKNDDEENTTLSLKKQDIENKIDEIRNRIDELEKLKEQMKEKTYLAATDSDCKLLLMNNGGFNPAYNVQAAVDEKNKMVVAVESTNAGNDFGQLSSISIQAKENLQISNEEKIIVVADKGYYNNNEFKKCADKNIEVLVSKIDYSRIVDKNYSKDKFIYDDNNNCYICPQNHKLTLQNKNVQEHENKTYKNKEVCKNCPVKNSCTKSAYRQIIDTAYENYAREVATRTRKNIELLKKRKSIIEHIFGTIKRNWGFDNFLTRGIEKVSTEVYIYFLTYNFMRFINFIK